MRAGLSHDRLALACGMSKDSGRPHLIKIEKNRVRPKAPLLSAIAEACGTTVDALLAAESEEEAASVSAVSFEDFLRAEIRRVFAEVRTEATA